MTEQTGRRHLGRRNWVVLSNSAMCIEAVGVLCQDVLFARSFGASVAPYGIPVPPLSVLVLRTLQEDAVFVLIAILLTWGAVGEARGQRSAFSINLIAYLLIAAGVLWDICRLPWDEHYIPMLWGAVPNLLVATANMLLYRREISGVVMRLFSSARSRGTASRG